MMVIIILLPQRHQLLLVKWTERTCTMLLMMTMMVRSYLSCSFVVLLSLFVVIRSFSSLIFLYFIVFRSCQKIVSFTSSQKLSIQSDRIGPRHFSHILHPFHTEYYFWCTVCYCCHCKHSYRFDRQTQKKKEPSGRRC